MKRCCRVLALLQPLGFTARFLVLSVVSYIDSLFVRHLLPKTAKAKAWQTTLQNAKDCGAHCCGPLWPISTREHAKHTRTHKAQSMQPQRRQRRQQQQQLAQEQTRRLTTTEQIIAKW